MARMALSRLLIASATCAAALAILAGCEERPAPRFDAPLVSGIITLPLRETQRFDTQLSSRGLLAALQGVGRRHLSVDEADAGLIVVQLPHAHFEAAILGLGAVAVDTLLHDGYAVVLGSGFTNVFNPVQPLGLLQLAGEIKSPPTPHGYTRILGASAGELAVSARDEFHSGLFEAAIQVGPGIVQNGRLDILQRERQLPAYIRAAAAICDDRWLAVVAQTPMHLYDLGWRLLRYLEARDLHCSEVVNLSGDREALLAILGADGNSIAYFGDPTLPKASIVAFRPTHKTRS